MTVRTTIPFVDLAAQYHSIAGEIDAAIRQVLLSNQFVLGEAVERFENNFAAYIGTPHAVGVGNGLDALRLSLLALGIGEGHEVILPANTFIATALAVTAVGARPVLVDCDEETYNLDPSLIETALTPRTKAIIAVHLTGEPADIDRIGAIARKHKLHLVEDAAQAHGAKYKDRRCGSFGEVGCFSFYPGKNLGAYGDGGMVTTGDANLAERIRQLRNYGERSKYDHTVKGVNSRLDALQAAVLDVKLRHLEEWNRARRTHASRYRELLKGVGDCEFQRVPAGIEIEHVYHLFVATTNSRDELREHLAAFGIQTGIHYPKPIHLQEAYRDLGYRAGDFPRAERLARRSLSLPMYAELTSGQVEQLSAQISTFFDSQSAIKTAAGRP